MIQVTVQLTITYLCWFRHQQQQQQKVEDKYVEEMLLPHTLEIKLGEEYSSVYYITIRVLLFYGNAEKRKRDMTC